MGRQDDGEIQKQHIPRVESGRGKDTRDYDVKDIKPLTLTMTDPSNSLIRRRQQVENFIDLV